MTTRLYVSALSLLLLGAGCNFAPSRVLPPEVDPSSAATAAMQQYDADSDGQLSQEELKKVPGMLKAIEVYDKNADKQISREEIQSRIQARLDSGLGMMAFSCKVEMNGRPLEGAEVKMIPESFQGAALKAAKGTTDASGMAVISIPVEDLPPGDKDLVGLMQPGLYRVEITHPSAKIGSRYNTDTTLGQELSNETVLESVTFEVSGN